MKSIFMTLKKVVPWIAALLLLLVFWQDRRIQQLDRNIDTIHALLENASALHKVAELGKNGSTLTADSMVTRQLVEMETGIATLEQRFQTLERLLDPSAQATGNTQSNGLPGNGTARIAHLESRLAATEGRFQALDGLVKQTVKTVVAGEVDREALRSQIPPPSASDLAKRKGRSWGPEQVTGAPDTRAPGDKVTAWAPKERDAGPEWLRLDYDESVPISEIRVLESYNPGAISRVSTLLPNGSEVTVWEGVQEGVEPYNESVFTANTDLRASSVVVHLDTSRVKGWNEIDAVELVGRDGSRQWASSVSASSSYAD